MELAVVIKWYTASNNNQNNKKGIQRLLRRKINQCRPKGIIGH